MVTNKMAKIGIGFSDGDPNGVAFVELNKGLAVARKIPCQGKEMMESERERVLQMGNDILHEMTSWKRQFIEEDAFDGATEKP